MPRKKDLKFVWPKDGYRGESKRGFFGGLSDIYQGKGPDIFLQESSSRASIKPDRWGNWDTYHLPSADLAEKTSRSFARRNDERYDPYSREYVKWGNPHDWSHHGVMGRDDETVPCFTQKERRKMYPQVRRGRIPDHRQMGDDWTVLGPKRWRPEHQWFWSNAHRIGNNFWYSGGNLDGKAQMYPYGITRPSELDEAVRREFW